jgi:hypothetical protein
MTNARVCAQNVRSRLVLAGQMVARCIGLVATIRAPIVVS